MTEEVAAKIWLILVAEVGVYDDEKGHDRYSFIFHQTQRESCSEYRIQGKLGFGGKFKCQYDRWYVDAYREDENPERRRIIDETNVKLAALRAEVFKQ